jgi:hypothetical protein
MLLTFSTGFDEMVIRFASAAPTGQRPTAFELSGADLLLAIPYLHAPPSTLPALTPELLSIGAGS